MDFHQLTTKTGKLLTDNSPIILTALGVVGTIGTAYLAHRAALRGSELVRLETADRKLKNDDTPISRTDKAKLLWTTYLPPVGVGVLTITSIVGANRISMRRTAAMTTAFALSERAYSEYKDKVESHIGKNKEQKVRDEIAQDRVTAKPVSGQQVFITGGGEVLCMDLLSGRYFMSSMETMRKAENSINQKVLIDDWASLTDFYLDIGLPPNKMSDDVGWHSPNNLLELKFSTTMSDDDRPCIAVDFHTAPVRDRMR